MPKNLRKISVAITLGDPAGIGPEVTYKALAALARIKNAHFIVIGARFLLNLRSLSARQDIEFIDLKNIQPGF